MSIKKSLDKLKQAIGRKAENPPITPAGGKCECCDGVSADGKQVCNCNTYTKEGKWYFGYQYSGPCGSRFPNCSCNGVYPTVVT